MSTKKVNEFGYIGISTGSGITFIHLLQNDIELIEEGIDKNCEKINELREQLEEYEKSNFELHNEVSERRSMQRAIDAQLISMGIGSELKYIIKEANKNEND